jgi:hypothetical protein
LVWRGLLSREKGKRREKERERVCVYMNGGISMSMGGYMVAFGGLHDWDLVTC